jgi:hypothetical protein
MLSLRNLATAGKMLALPVAISLPASFVSAQGGHARRDQGPDTPMEVTSDTPEYCLKLLDRVSELVRLSAEPAPAEVTMLSTEGDRLCHHGQLRGGILRLRRALLMMEDTGDNHH